jgi:hypothetical protein
VIQLAVAAAQLGATGSQEAVPGDLDRLLGAAALSDPDISAHEDFEPSDPRDRVVVEAWDSLYRLFPGEVERPVADVNRLIDLAALLDETLTDANGFGIRHLAEVVLGHVSDTVVAAEATWPASDVPGLTEQELALIEPPTRLPTPEHQAALQWATRASAELRHDPGSPMSAVGSAMLVLSPVASEPVWMPLAALPSALNAAAAELAAQAARDPELERRYAQHVAARIRRRLWRFSPVLTGAPDVPDGPAVSPRNVAQWTAAVGATRMLAVQQRTSLAARWRHEGETAVARVARVARDAAANTSLPLPHGAAQVPPGCEVTPIEVTATAAHLVVSGPPTALHLSLEDLDWIARSASDASDLFHFARELTVRGGPRILSWEAVDTWEWWRANRGVLYRSGVQPSLIAVDPHGGAAEWDLQRTLFPLEEALFTLRLPPVREWDLIDPRDDAPTWIARWPVPTGHAPLTTDGRHVRPPVISAAVHIGAAPATFILDAALGSAEAAHLASDLAGSYAHSLRRVHEQWDDALASAGLAGVRVRLHVVEDGLDATHFISTTPGLARVGEADLTIDLARFATQGDDRPNELQALLAESICDVLTALRASSGPVTALCEALLAAPATLTVRSYQPITTRNRLAPPIEVEDPLQGQIDARFAAEVAASAIRPGTYGPTEALALDRDVLAPSAKSLLLERLAPFRTDSLVRFGMVQIERVLSRRAERLRDISQTAGKVDTPWDPAERQASTERQHLDLRRANELLIEAALTRSGEGRKEVDERAWAEAIAASASYLESVTRSESLFHQVSSTGLKISSDYSLQLAPAPEESTATTLIRLDEFTRAAAAEQLADTPLPDTDHTQLTRAREAADHAFADAFGASNTDLTMALLALAAWPVDPRQLDAVDVTREQALTRIVDACGWDREPARAAAALDLLLSASPGYTDEDWLPWRLRSRRTRLLTRPVVVLTSGSLVIAPHLCEAVANVYLRYWLFGLLPWSTPGTPRLEAALNTVRNERNLELERQVDALLRVDGWTTITRVKKGDAARIGLQSLSGELDIVTGRPGDPTIWLLEVKDPAPSFDPRDIRRQIDRFHGPGKSYAIMLARKHAELAGGLTAVAAALSLPPGTDYRLRSAFVTRQVVPAAFTGSAHEFMTAAALTNTMRTASR